MNLYSASTDGLKWGYYTGYFTDNVSFFTGAPVASGIVTGIPSINAGTGGYVPADQSREYYSVQWTGYFLSNYTGTWTFYTSSDDASYLWIGPNATTGFSNTNAIVINGGLHGMQERSGTVSLVAGEYYPIRIQFGENQQGDNIIVSFSNPNLTKTTNGQGFFYTVPRLATLNGPQPQIFLGPLMSYPTATGTPPSNDGTKLTFARASLQFLNFGSQTFDMTKGFSATCRFAFTGTAVAYERIFDFGKGQNNDNLILCRTISTQQISFYFQNGSVQYFAVSTNSFTQGQVNTVTVIYTHSPVSLTIILNGVTTTAIPAAAATTPRTLNLCYVGKSNWTDDPYPNIDIYSLNIYNRVLTPNELIGTPAPSPWGIFMATPNGLTAAQAATSGLALKQGYPGYTSGTYWIKPTSGSVAGLAFVDMTTDGGGWTLAYETVNATRDGTGAIVYSVNNSSNLSALTFTRVAYSMNNFNSWAFTSFDSWSSTLSAHRIPSGVDAFVNQRRVNNLNVVSSNTNVTTGTGLAGALEIWPSNYTTPKNTSIGTYGSDTKHDINDSGAGTGGGYGSFQVHDITNFRPVICWNAHGGASPDIGFGPNPDLAGHTDWTHTYRGATSDFRVRVFVR
jgi:hypothetical protein